jgi:hypothetical protein
LSKTREREVFSAIGLKGFDAKNGLLDRSEAPARGVAASFASLTSGSMLGRA